MLIKDRKMDCVQMVVRRRNGDFVGVALFNLKAEPTVDTYKVCGFLIEKPVRDMSTDEDYPSYIQEEIFRWTIDFADKKGRANALAHIAMLLFPEKCVINFSFENKEIVDTLGGEVIYD